MRDSEPNLRQEQIKSLFDSRLNDPVTVDGLLYSEPEVLESITSELTGLSDQELGIGVRHLFRKLGTDDSENWTQDGRDAALKILEIAPLCKLENQFILDSYVDSVKELSEETDLMGGGLSLVEAGRFISPYFPQTHEAIATLQSIWDNFIISSKGEEKAQLRREARKIVRNIHPPIQPNPGLVEDEQGHLGTRDKPEYSGRKGELLDRYLDIAKANGTIKLDLWRNTSQFREKAANLGVNLESFWNLSNPDLIEKGVSILMQLDNPEITRFARHIRTLTGLELQTASSEEIRVVSDQVRDAAILTIRELEGSIQTFPEALARMTGLMDKANEVNGSSKKIVEAIRGFLTSNGVDDPPSSIADLKKVFEDPIVLATAEAGFAKRQKSKIDFIAVMQGTLATEEKNPNFSLISRGEQDLYLGDQTGDCTSYHLNVGFNAWTLPSWLFNPGFNFFITRDNSGNLLSKAGIYIAVEGGEPVLLIDSFEVGKKINDEGKEKIKEGVAYLKEWSESIGFRAVFSNGVSNDELGLSTLEEMSTRDKNGLSLFEQLNGVGEYEKKIYGDQQIDSTYIQSRVGEYDPDEDHVSASGIRLIEKVYRETGAKLKREEADALTNAGINKDWTTFYTILAKVNFPLLTERLGGYDDIREIFERFEFDFDKVFDELSDRGKTPYAGLEDKELDEKIRIAQKKADGIPYHDYSKEEITQIRSELGILLSESSIRARKAKALPYHDKEGHLRSECFTIGNLIETIDALEKAGTSPEMALDYLFNGRNDVLLLRSNLWKLN